MCDLQYLITVYTLCFHSCNSVFQTTEILRFDKVQFTDFFFSLLWMVLFMSHSRSLCLTQGLKELWFWILHISLWSILSQYFIWWEEWIKLGFVFYILSSCFKTICWKDYLSALNHFHIFVKSICHICMGLFLTSLFCSTALHICPFTNTTLSWWE